MVDLGEEREHHEKKFAVKKVKDKAKTIKNTIGKNMHGNGHDHRQVHGSEQDHSCEEDEEEVAEEQPEVHGAPSM